MYMYANFTVHFVIQRTFFARWRSTFLSWAENSDILNFVEKKEYVHIEYSGPLTRLSSVLCKTLYTYIYLGDTKLHICKKKLATIKLQAYIVH